MSRIEVGTEGNTIIDELCAEVKLSGRLQLESTRVRLRLLFQLKVGLLGLLPSPHLCCSRRVSPTWPRPVPPAEPRRRGRPVLAQKHVPGVLGHHGRVPSGFEASDFFAFSAYRSSIRASCAPNSQYQSFSSRKLASVSENSLSKLERPRKAPLRHGMRLGTPTSSSMALSDLGCCSPATASRPISELPRYYISIPSSFYILICGVIS